MVRIARQRALVAIAAILCVVAPAAAQVSPVLPDEAGLQLLAVTFQHQSAREALQVVLPLLSPRGTVEIQPEANTLLLRDTGPSLARMLPILRQFDHPVRPVRLEIQMVRASSDPLPAGTAAPLVRSPSPEVVARLRKLLPFASYELLARADLSTRERETVTYELGAGYRVQFELGTVVDGRRVRLSDFRVLRIADGEQLLHTHVNLPLEQTLVLGLTAQAGSPRALMVVLRGRATEGR